MYMNKPSVTKTEDADRLNLLHSTIYRFEHWESCKAGHLCPDILHFMIFIKKTLAFRHTN